MRWIVIALALLCASPALAGWVVCPGDVSDTGTTSGTATRGKNMCYRTNGANNPPRINTMACSGGVDFSFISDIAGAGTTATAYPYACSNATASGATLTDCRKVQVDRDLNGSIDDVPMNGDGSAGRLGTYNLPPMFYAFAIVNGSSTTFDLTVSCR